MVRPAHIKFKTPLQEKIANIVEHSNFVGFVTALIIINTITLGLETSAHISARAGLLFHILDISILSVFTIELLGKLFAYRLSFFKSGWNIFDFLIVAIAWVPASGPFSVLRALRILRALRLLSVVPSLRRVITALGRSIPGMSSVFGVLCLIFYICAVITTKVFGTYPDPQMHELFGTIGNSTFTLFQVMTLEGWTNDVVFPTMKIFPWAWMFFVPFIIVTSFAVLNLFIGIIVDAMNTMDNDENADVLEKHDLKALHNEITEIKAELKKIAKKMPD